MTGNFPESYLRPALLKTEYHFRRSKMEVSDRFLVKVEALEAEGLFFKKALLQEMATCTPLLAQGPVLASYTWLIKALMLLEDAKAGWLTPKIYERRVSRIWVSGPKFCPLGENREQHGWHNFEMKVEGLCDDEDYPR